jgi:hypothetical protein
LEKNSMQGYTQTQELQCVPLLMNTRVPSEVLNITL